MAQDSGRSMPEPGPIPEGVKVPPPSQGGPGSRFYFRYKTREDETDRATVVSGISRDDALQFLYNLQRAGYIVTKVMPIGPVQQGPAGVQTKAPSKQAPQPATLAPAKQAPQPATPAVPSGAIESYDVNDPTPYRWEIGYRKGPTTGAGLIKVFTGAEVERMIQRMEQGGMTVTELRKIKGASTESPIPKLVLQQAPEPSAKATRISAETKSGSGSMLAGKYELLRQIGEGGMGLVYEARDHSLDRSVAIKKMRSEIKLNLREKNRFLQEAKTSASLHHPFIADIYAILDEGDEIYLVFEYIDGRTLDQVMEVQSPMALSEARPVLKCVCEALAFAHASKIVHRDLKPSNIMVTKQGYAKVMDFGIARQMKDTASRLTKVDSSGTMAYMAPEQELGKFDARSDIFSLGATVYELLSGELSFPGPNFYLQKEKMTFKPLRDIDANLPEVLTQAVERCLQFDPKDRFQSVAEFAKCLNVEWTG